MHKINLVDMASTVVEEMEDGQKTHHKFSKFLWLFYLALQKRILSVLFLVVM